LKNSLSFSKKFAISLSAKLTSSLCLFLKKDLWYEKVGVDPRVQAERFQEKIIPVLFGESMLSHTKSLIFLLTLVSETFKFLTCDQSNKLSSVRNLPFFCF